MRVRRREEIALAKDGNQVVGGMPHVFVAADKQRTKKQKPHEQTP